jgi:hypothetical protein
MVTKIKVLRECAVVAGIEVHQFKAGDIAGIEMTEAEIKFSVDRGDIAVLGQQSEAPVVAPVVESAPVAEAPAAVEPGGVA